MAGQHTFTIEQGADWSRVIRWQDEAGNYISFVGYSARMQMRKRDGTLVVELSTANGKITIAGTSLTLALTDTETAALEGGSPLYDLFLTSSGGVDTRLLAGVVDIVERVTQ